MLKLFIYYRLIFYIFKSNVFCCEEFLYELVLMILKCCVKEVEGIFLMIDC